MKSLNDFPNQQEYNDYLRVYFAAMAMQGYMANEFTPHEDPERIADYSVRYADALIAALNKKTE